MNDDIINLKHTCPICGHVEYSGLFMFTITFVKLKNSLRNYNCFNCGHKPMVSGYVDSNNTPIPIRQVLLDN